MSNNGIKLIFDSTHPLDIDYIKSQYKLYPDKKIIIEIPNTVGLSMDFLENLPSDVFIRVAGGFDEKRVQMGPKIRKNSSYYTTAVIYTRNELCAILSEMQRIEAGIDKSWDEIQKAIYIYDVLKREIMYDPKFKEKTAAETSSLRGLVTKQTVCAGYSLIYKEMLDRQGIECEYVEGNTHADQSYPHAWNIIVINGKKYPIDLTWDNSRYRSGKYDTFDYLGQDVVHFSKTHIPLTFEKTQNYLYTLSDLPKDAIKDIYYHISQMREYRSNIFPAKRSNGSCFLLVQIGSVAVDGQEYYQYYYCDEPQDGVYQNHTILYSETNISDLVNREKFGKDVPDKWRTTIVDILLSKANIDGSLFRKTHYIGDIRQKKNGQPSDELVTSYWQITKDKGKKDVFQKNVRRLTRSDGTVFLLQFMIDKPIIINGIKVYYYNVFELLNDNNNIYVRRNIVYSDSNFMYGLTPNVIDEFFNRQRLDGDVNKCGGYAGYIDDQGHISYNDKLVSYFKNNHQDSYSITDVSDAKIQSITLFDELRELAANYEVFYDPSGETELEKFKIRNIQTGEIISDDFLFVKAMYANIWLGALGTKKTPGEERDGISIAFCSKAGVLYYDIYSWVEACIKNDGNIDFEKLAKIVLEHNNDSGTVDVLKRLFKSDLQRYYINRFMLNTPYPFLIDETKSKPKEGTSLYDDEVKWRI